MRKIINLQEWKKWPGASGSGFNRQIYSSTYKQLLLAKNYKVYEDLDAIDGHKGYKNPQVGT